MLVGAPSRLLRPCNSTALERAGSAGTRAGQCAPARSHRDGGIMMRATGGCWSRRAGPCDPAFASKPPPNVALQLTGDWCEEGVVAARLAPHVRSLHLAGGHVARS
jgi:hypothetical protein